MSDRYHVLGPGVWDNREDNWAVQVFANVFPSVWEFEKVKEEICKLLNERESKKIKAGPLRKG